MFFLKDVLGILTLQTSTIVLSSVFITLAVCVISRNVLSFEITSVAWIIMFLFVLLMVMIWIIAFVGAYEESYKIITAAIVLWTVYIIAWIGLVVWLFVNTQTNKSVCLEFRCPNGIWLLYNSRRDLYNENELIDILNRRSIKKPINNIQPQYKITNKPQSIKNVEKYRSILENKYNKSTTTTIDWQVTLPIELPNNDEEKLIKKFKTNIEFVQTYCGTHLETTNHLLNEIASIIFSFLFMLLLIFSWMVLISYRREIILQINFPSHNEE